MPPNATAGQTSLEKLRRLSAPRKPSVHRLRSKLTHSKVSATSAGNTDTLPKSVGVRSKEGQRSVNARSVDKDIMNDVGHEATHQHTRESQKRRMERW